MAEKSSGALERLPERIAFWHAHLFATLPCAGLQPAFPKEFPMKEVLNFLRQLEAEHREVDRQPEYALYRLPGSLPDHYAELARTLKLPAWEVEVEPAPDWQFVILQRLGTEAAETLVQLLREHLDFREVQRVRTRTPAWYDAVYDDLVLVCPFSSWLLHLGISD